MTTDEGKKDFQTRHKAWERRVIVGAVIMLAFIAATVIGISVMLITIFGIEGFITLMAFAVVIITLAGLVALAQRLLNEEEPTE